MRTWAVSVHPVSSGASCGLACGGEGWLWQSWSWGRPDGSGPGASVVLQLGWLRSGVWGVLHTTAVFNTKTCGVLSSKNSRGSVVAMLTLGFRSGKSCWGPLQRRSLGTTALPTMWLMQVACPSFS